MKSPISIRDFHAQDFHDVVAQWHRTNVLSYPYSAEHQRHTLADAQKHFREVVLRTCRVYVAEFSAKPAGLLALETPWIRQLAVFAPFQRRGVGRALLAKAKDMSVGELRLFTFQRNTSARSFYESAGFVPIRLGVSPAPESEPDVEYRWLR